MSANENEIGNVFDDADPGALDTRTFRTLAGQEVPAHAESEKPLAEFLSDLEVRLIKMAIAARDAGLSVSAFDLLTALGRRPVKMASGVITELHFARRCASMAWRLLRDSGVSSSVQEFIQDAMDRELLDQPSMDPSPELNRAMDEVAAGQARIAERIRAYERVLRDFSVIH